MKNNNNIKTFEQYKEKLNISDVSESVSGQEMDLINKSKLFFTESSSYLNDETKLKIVEWYNNLIDINREYVDILRSESVEREAYYNENH